MRSAIKGIFRVCVYVCVCECACVRACVRAWHGFSLNTPLPGQKYWENFSVFFFLFVMRHVTLL
jgi:hypothetical protein